MATKDKRVNASLDNTLEILEKQENRLIEEEVITENKPKEEELREKVQDTFEAYPNAEMLWVVALDESVTSFLEKDLTYAAQYAKQVNRKIHKITR